MISIGDMEFLNDMAGFLNDIHSREVAPAWFLALYLIPTFSDANFQEYFQNIAGESLEPFPDFPTTFLESISKFNGMAGCVTHSLQKPPRYSDPELAWGIAPYASLGCSGPLCCVTAWKQLCSITVRRNSSSNGRWRGTGCSRDSSDDTSSARRCSYAVLQ